MGFVWLLFVYVCSVGVKAGEVAPCTNPTEGYFWRDYTGTIPSDAIPGGTDGSGETTYIGQALHPGGHLTPGVIRKGSSQVFYEYGNAAHKAEEDVKILCSQRPKQFVWLQVNLQGSIFNVNGTLIIAGHDTAGPLSIGRKKTGSEIAVGKALLYHTQFGGMWYATASGPGFVNDHFEILVFNPSSAVEQQSCSSKPVHINFYC